MADGAFADPFITLSFGGTAAESGCHSRRRICEAGQDDHRSWLGQRVVYLAIDRIENIARLQMVTRGKARTASPHSLESIRGDAIRLLNPVRQHMLFVTGAVGAIRHDHPDLSEIISGEHEVDG